MVVRSLVIYHPINTPLNNALKRRPFLLLQTWTSFLQCLVSHCPRYELHVIQQAGQVVNVKVRGTPICARTDIDFIKNCQPVAVCILCVVLWSDVAFRVKIVVSASKVCSVVFLVGVMSVIIMEIWHY